MDEIKQLAKKKIAITDRIGRHVMPELRRITPQYAELFHLDENHLASFAVLILTEALINQKIMLRRNDD
jgi:hypothetical protein